MYVAQRIDAGTCFVNTYNKTDVAAPFGGFKQSGFGKDLGEEALNEYLKTKCVTVEYNASFWKAALCDYGHVIPDLIKMSLFSWSILFYMCTTAFTLVLVFICTGCQVYILLIFGLHK